MFPPCRCGDRLAFSANCWIDVLPRAKTPTGAEFCIDKHFFLSPRDSQAAAGWGWLGDAAPFGDAAACADESSYASNFYWPGCADWRRFWFGKTPYEQRGSFAGGARSFMIIHCLPITFFVEAGFREKS